MESGYTEWQTLGPACEGKILKRDQHARGTSENYSWFLNLGRNSTEYKDFKRRGYVSSGRKFWTNDTRYSLDFALEGYRIPNEFNFSQLYSRLRDIMLDGGNNWNQNLVQALFSPQISSLILNTPILDLEQERLVWTPSLTWSFSVKTSYNLIIKSRLNSLQGQDINWKLIWGGKTAWEACFTLMENAYEYTLHHWDIATILFLKGNQFLFL